MIFFRVSLKSPWSRRKRKKALSKQQWISFFTPEGKLRDGGVKFLKKVRSGVSIAMLSHACELDVTLLLVTGG